MSTFSQLPTKLLSIWRPNAHQLIASS